VPTTRVYSSACAGREQVQRRTVPRKCCSSSSARALEHFTSCSGKEGAGREVIYVKGGHENKSTRCCRRRHALMPAGRRIALPGQPHGPIRQPALDYRGRIGDIIDRLADRSRTNERGDRRSPTLTLLGPQRRPEFAGPLDAVELAYRPATKRSCRAAAGAGSSSIQKRTAAGAGHHARRTRPRGRVLLLRPLAVIR